MSSPQTYTQTDSTADRIHSAKTGVVLTDNSGGTASQTIAAIGATYDQAEVRNAVASLADEVNKIIADIADVAALVNAVIDDLQASHLRIVK